MVALVRQTLHAHGGAFDPSNISHKRMGLAPENEHVYETFDKLLKPGQLKPFIERHPEFPWQPTETGRRMVIKWAAAEGGAGPSGADGSKETAPPLLPSEEPRSYYHDAPAANLVPATRLCGREYNQRTTCPRPVALPLACE